MLRDPARFWLPLVILYFGLHTVLRVANGQPLTSDEAWLAEHAWQLRLHYDGMAPLYPWIQHLMFEALGPGVLALALLKNGVLAVLSIGICLLVRHAAGYRWGWLALLATLLLPEVVWSWEVADAGDLIAAALSVVMVLLLTLYRAHQSLPRLIGLALVSALGGLAGAGFAWALGAVILAAATLDGYRVLFLRGYALAALGVGWISGIAALCFGALSVPDLSAALALDAAERGAAAANYLQKMFSSIVLLMAVVFFAIVVGYNRAQEMPPAAMELRRLLSRVTAIGVVLILLGAFAGAGIMAGGWRMLPVTVFLAPAAALFLAPTISERGVMRVTCVAAVIALIALISNPVKHGRVLEADQRNAIVSEDPFVPTL